MIVRMIAGNLLWIRCVKVSNLFSNHAELEQFRRGLEIVRKLDENCDYFSVYA
jgi:hypothetical protein